MAIDAKFALGYLADYYSRAKRPTAVRAKVLLADIGIDSRSANELIAIIQKYGVAKYKSRLQTYLKAYTKTEKVLQDDIPANELAPDYMLLNDEFPGDAYDFKDELVTDGIEDQETLDAEQDLLTNDSSFR